MKFQIKIIFATTVIMIAILFYLNTMLINFAEYMKEDLLYQMQEKNKITKRDFVEEKFQEYVKNVLLWELLLVLSLMLILYKVIERLTQREREYRDFLELILFTISHKFGNFLAAQRGNIEILKIKHDLKAINRLETSYKYLQEDFQNMLTSINKFKEFSYEKEKVNLKELLEKIIAIFNAKEEKISLEDVFIYANKQIVENIISPIIENAVKYSDGDIKIRLTKKYLAVRNKIRCHEQGSGVGLKIAEALAKKLGFNLLFRGKGEYFITLLKFR